MAIKYLDKELFYRSGNCQGKVRTFYFELVKIELLNTNDLIPLKAGRKIWDHSDFSNVFFFYEEGKFGENLSVLKIGWKGQLKGELQRLLELFSSRKDREKLEF